MVVDAGVSTGSINPDSLLPVVLVSGWGQPVHWITPVLPPGLPQVQAWSLKDFTSDSPAAWLAQAMAQAPQRAVWLGWSLGGQLAMAAARDYPERVAGVMTLCATPCFVASDDWLHGRPEDEFAQFARRCHRQPAVTLRRFARLQSLGDQYQQQALQEGPAAAAGNTKAPDTEGLLKTLSWLRDTDQRVLWQQPLAMPRWHLFGANDPLVSAQTGNALGLSGSQQQVLAGLAHWPFGPHLPRLQHLLMNTLRCWSNAHVTA